MLEPQKVLHLHIEEKKKKPQINYDYLMLEKLDGWYVYIDYISGTWHYPRSSAGRIIPSFQWMRDEGFLDKHIKPLPIDCRFIVEATIDGKLFHEANGLFNRSKGDCSCRDVIFNFHDLVPLRAENNHYRNSERYWMLQDEIQFLSEQFRLIPLLGVSSNKNTWYNVADKIWDRGGEGLILKRANDVYHPGKRNASMLKIKLEEEFDLLCVNMYTTIGEKGNENLNLDLKNLKGIVVPVRIGKYSDIAEFERSSPIGKVVQIRAMCQLEDGSYREPRFVGVRYDKKQSEID